jgi:hypothetical protein
MRITAEKKKSRQGDALLRCVDMLDAHTRIVEPEVVKPELRAIVLKAVDALAPLCVYDILETAACAACEMVRATEDLLRVAHGLTFTAQDVERVERRRVGEEQPVYVE